MMNEPLFQHEQAMQQLLTPELRRGLQQKMNIYSAAIEQMKLKLDIWNNEFKFASAHNPIHHVESRIKSPESIVGKLQRRGLVVRVDHLDEYITDIAGVRVVCRYIDDVYQIAGLLRNCGMEILRIRDYIREPKPNGYRSYHIILQVPIELSSRRTSVPVEIQIRTIAMDTWASLEHEILYKVDDEERESKAAYLLECAEELAAIDLKMQSLFRSATMQKAASL